MISRQNWIDHKFNLGLDIGWTQNVLSRIQDTSIRLEYHCLDLSEIQLSSKIDDAWSIKEHIGHLIDLEILWTKRFNEFIQGHETLQAADMSNAKTEAANHNKKTTDALISSFKQEREKLLQLYYNLDEKTQEHQAMHPRIQQLIRPIDLLFFIAEHDDHHMVSITSIKQTLTKTNP